MCEGASSLPALVLPPFAFSSLALPAAASPMDTPEFWAMLVAIAPGKIVVIATFVSMSSA